MIDPNRIQELEEEIGAGDLGVIVDIFLTEAQSTIAFIATGLSEADHARATHFLRSGALNIGLRGVAMAADEAAAVAPDARAATAADIQAALDLSVAELQSMVPAT